MLFTDLVNTNAYYLKTWRDQEVIGMNSLSGRPGLSSGGGGRGKSETWISLFKVDPSTGLGQVSKNQ